MVACDRGGGLYGGVFGFEGTIPEGECGAGEVKVSDTGTFIPLTRGRDRIEVVLNSREHRGKDNLIRFPKGGEKAWLIVKSRETHLPAVLADSPVFSHMLLS